MFQTVRNDIEFVGSFGIDIVPRRTDKRAALGRIEFRNFLKQRIEMHMRCARIEQAVEAFDQSIHFDAELVRARYRAVDRGVERGRVASCRKDSESLHLGLISLDVAPAAGM